MNARFELPLALTIPAATAATIRFVGTNLSARDISFAITVAWLAANRPDIAIPVDDQAGLYDISDNGLREALGLGRRDGADKEAQRFERLSLSAAWIDDQDIPLPTLYSMGLHMDRPMRAKNLDGYSLRWMVSERLVEAFRMNDAAPMIRIPMHLIRAARNRYSVQMMCWIGAWQAGHLDGDHIHHRTADSLIVRFRPEAWLDMLWRDVTLPAAALMKDVLVPVADEITQFADHYVEAETRKTKYRGGKVGKIIDVQLRIHRLVTDTTVETFDERVQRIVAERLAAAEQMIRDADTKPKAWRKPVRKSFKRRPEPSPADVTNVVALPVGKMRSIRPAIDQQYPEDGLAFALPPGHGSGNEGDR